MPAVLPGEEQELLSEQALARQARVAELAAVFEHGSAEVSAPLPAAEPELPREQALALPA